MRYDIEINRWEYFGKTFSIFDGNGNVVNISGWTFGFVVKKPEYLTDDTSDEHAVYKQIKLISDGSSGKITFNWNKVDADIGKYKYVMFYIRDGKRKTILDGNFIVKAVAGGDISG